MKLYGIKNCDTVKKACKWLKENNISYEFYDYKKTPPNEALINYWIDDLGLEVIVNKRGTTYRKLNDNDKSNLETKESAIKIIIDNSSIIKRPILDTGKKLIAGFHALEYKDINE